jgi:hypothetical protein
MPIRRCSDQKRQTLEEFYTEWASYNDHSSSDLGKSMLSIIELANKLFLETNIYGLTSHAHLMFLSEDRSDSDRFVTIIANGSEFYIEYLFPREQQPWKDGSVKGMARSLEEFKDYIIIAMTKSQGWKDSEELKRLYLQTKDKYNNTVSKHTKENSQ